MTDRQRRLAERNEPIARDIMRAINTMSMDGHEVGRLLANEHRTLQQSFAAIVVGFIDAMAENANQGWTDGRNEASAEFFQAMSEAYMEKYPTAYWPPHFPFI